MPRGPGSSFSHSLYCIVCALGTVLFFKWGWGRKVFVFGLHCYIFRELSYVFYHMFLFTFLFLFFLFWMGFFAFVFGSFHKDSLIELIKIFF